MSGISVSRVVASWIRAALVAGTLGPSIAPAQTAGTGTESASAESGAKPAVTVAVALSERMTLDLAWRYTDFGAVRTGRGRGFVVWRDGSREPLELDLAETRADLSSHGILASLRYAF